MVIQVETNNNYLLIEHFKNLYPDCKGVAQSLILSEQKEFIKQTIRKLLSEGETLENAIKHVKHLKQVEISYILDENGQYLYLKVWKGILT